jgi:trans-aconitate methyltransferase
MSFQHIQLSPRLAEIVHALPLRPGMRVLAIGGAPGTAARAIVQRIPGVHVLVIDRSGKGVAQMERLAASEIAAGRMSVRCVAAEEFVLAPGEAPTTWRSPLGSARSTVAIHVPASRSATG